MAEIQLPNQKIQEEILRRGVEADAFIHSPLFVALEEWVKQEEQQILLRIVTDTRSKSQEKLSRLEITEQAIGYYKGLQTFLGVFQGFVMKASELQKLLNQEEEKKQLKEKQELDVEKLRKKAYPNGR